MTTIHVLWTGGWDSTYRVLELSLVHGVIVQPHYLLDRGRESIGYELAAMRTIRAAALERGGLINPVRTLAIDQLTVSSDIAETHHVLRERYHIGEQYLWLAQYAHEREIPELELCIHKDDRAADMLEHLNSGQDGESMFTAKSVDSPENLLSIFTFPLLELTKYRIFELACAHGFDDLLELTWFCHRPTGSGKPCGFCNPCRWTREEGLSHRLPIGAKCRDGLDKWLISHIPGFRLRRWIRYRLRKAG